MSSTDDIMKRLYMIFEEKRLESYKQWPFTDKDVCSIKKLAEAGFFWTGTNKEPDSAQCFVCNKSLDGWESTDDPWFEHKKHEPQCPFIVLEKKEGDLTLDQFYNLWTTMARNLANLTVAEYDKKIMMKVDDIRDELMAFKNRKRERK